MCWIYNTIPWCPWLWMVDLMKFYSNVNSEIWTKWNSEFLNITDSSIELPSNHHLISSLSSHPASLHILVVPTITLIHSSSSSSLSASTVTTCSWIAPSHLITHSFQLIPWYVEQCRIVIRSLTPCRQSITPYSNLFPYTSTLLLFPYHTFLPFSCFLLHHFILICRDSFGQVPRNIRIDAFHESQLIRDQLRRGKERKKERKGEERKGEERREKERKGEKKGKRWDVESV